MILSCDKFIQNSEAGTFLYVQDVLKTQSNFRALIPKYLTQVQPQYDGFLFRFWKKRRLYKIRYYRLNNFVQKLLKQYIQRIQCKSKHQGQLDIPLMQKKKNKLDKRYCSRIFDQLYFDKNQRHLSIVFKSSIKKEKTFNI